MLLLLMIIKYLYFVIGRGFYGQTQNRASYEASGGQNENLERDVVCCSSQREINQCISALQKN